MSGIFGILNRDGAPVDSGWLWQTTCSMAYRGPDAQQVWCGQAVGLGHALLRTTPESAAERQPCTLDGQTWIAADARIDARAELIAALESAGRREVRQATDAELILHAYHVWGEEGPQHLAGDFAFLIWDGSRRALFGARDPFGLKPFYYAETGQTLLCGNTLNCLRRAPGVSGKLNDDAIAGFLLFDCNQDPAATYFADICRLPPGHCLVAAETGLQIRRYWRLPVHEIRYRRGWDYMDRFRELFEAAVRDRLRTDRAAVLMSGGLDSTLVAAFANRLLGEASASSGLHAHTIVYDRLFADRERQYSGAAAGFLRIPVDYLPADDYDLYEQDRHRQFSKPEPEHNPIPGIQADCYRRIAGYARVTLSGMGGDPAIVTDDRYIAHYLKPAALWEFVMGVVWCLRVGRRIPRLGIRTLILNRPGREKPWHRYRYPDWLDPEFEKTLNLRDRWELFQRQPSHGRHPRSRVRHDLENPLWPALFESLDPGFTGFPVEHRHPFFDPRVAAFLAGLPALPWCQEKNILRAVGAGLLPDLVRLRPKTPLVANPVLEKLRRCGPEWWARRLDPLAPELARYVTLQALPGLAASPGEGLRVLSLNYWLQGGRNVTDFGSECNGHTQFTDSGCLPTRT